MSSPLPPSSKGSTSTTMSTATSSSALYSFKLLEALRSDDPSKVQPFIDELRPSNGSLAGLEDSVKAGKLLGMAVRVASGPVITRILNSSNIPNPNVPVTSGSMATALHVASEIGRVDAVEILLAHPRVSDTIRDEQGRTPLECAGNQEVAALIEESRTALQIHYAALLAAYVSSSLSSLEESAAITQFIEGPRTDIVNLNALDERSGTSLLHEAARRRDLKLVELAVKRGADVFVRDKKGKRVLDGEKGADERIKLFLKQFSTQDSLVHNQSDGRPPDLRGFLSKWVNYKEGWRTRWFVLENGVLSYYLRREDEAIACRGSIALQNATLQETHDGSRFEVHSRKSSSVPRMIVKSAHRAEIARWVQTIKLNIEYHRTTQEVPQPKITNVGTVRASSLKTSNSNEKPISSAFLAPPATDAFLDPELRRVATSLSGINAYATATGRGRRRSTSPARTVGSLTEDEGGDTLSIIEAADKESILGSVDHAHSAPGVPHDSSFDRGLLNIKAQIELTQQLVDSIVVSPPPSLASNQSSPMVRTSSRQQAVKEALRSSLHTLSTQISAQNIMSQDRERYFFSRIQREVEARRLWEENMLTVAEQQAETDRLLTEAARDNEKKRKALRQARGVLAGLSGTGSIPTSPAMGGDSSGVIRSTGPGILDIAPNTAQSTTSYATAPTTLFSPGETEIQQAQEAIIAAGATSDDEDGDEDEFFDAVEQNTIPNLKLHDSIAHPEKERPGTPIKERKGFAVAPVQKPIRGTIKEYLARQSLQPYANVRSKLPIDDDKRPSVSLWSILKSSVGKDLTKISFPVSFNECTSMLQRMAEDMEYDACLTVAAGEQDSLKRIAYVAAFAMSNYSSTIGRIAKPFNPLLSQSFEYAVPNRYRYISEQVSHHPPISACYCEAPTWKYFGEVDAKNKFGGTSFEIKPTGVAHVELVIPKKWVDPSLGYPQASEEYGTDLVVEHYSWKKVTTVVSGIITGSPVIDHYGDLVVTNHRTGETCTLTFKQGTSYFKKAPREIKGQVEDPHGRVAWDIAGRWNSQLIARQAGASSKPLDVDTEYKPSAKEYLLLWRNSEKPKEPFNLTPFAITLNDIPQGLGQYLAPTDCRLRTDQRAFENAEYDKAQGLKVANEEKQRMTRKMRAEGKLPPHEARWFTESQDPDSGERLWEPKRADDGEVLFWAKREKTDWAGIDQIFEPV